MNYELGSRCQVPDWLEVDKQKEHELPRAAMSCHELSRCEVGKHQMKKFFVAERVMQLGASVQQVTRLVFCSGKLYYELVAEREQLLACTSKLQ